MAQDEQLCSPHKKSNRKRHKKHAGGGSYHIGTAYRLTRAERSAEIEGALARRSRRGRLLPARD
jgi:hypothetical protein